MKFGKIIGILVVVLVAVTFLGIASAAEVTVGSQHFNLPDGFKENTTAAKEMVSSNSGSGSSSINSKTIVKKFSDGKNNVIIDVVELSDGGKPKLEEESGFSNKTINGVDGVYNPDKHEFRYVNGSNIIHVFAINESLIEDFVMA